jgi:hypothetical protein
VLPALTVLPALALPALTALTVLPALALPALTALSGLPAPRAGADGVGDPRDRQAYPDDHCRRDYGQHRRHYNEDSPEGQHARASPVFRIASGTVMPATYSRWPLKTISSQAFLSSLPP